MSSSTSSPFDLLLADGVIDGVIGQLKTGKEAEVYLVQHQGQVVAAKVYKERHARNFKNNAGYTEGRAVRNSRTRRAIEKGSRFGQAAAEEAWKSHEADALFKLHAQGVRVPTPVMFYEGVLLMECVTDPDGQPAPRLVEVAPETADDARLIYEDIRAQVVRMLASDVIHGDLSPFNILMGVQGPVIIDFPQTVAAAGNNRAEFYFRRDLDTVRSFLAGFDPRLHATAGETGEIWHAYVKRELTADFVPSGRGGGAHAGPRRHPAGPRPEGAHPRGPRPQHGAPGRPQQHPRGPRHEHTQHPAAMHAGRDRAEEAQAAARSHAQTAPEGVDAAEAELRALEALVLRQGGGERGKPPPSKPPPGGRRHGRGPGRPPGQASGGGRPQGHGAGAGARPPQQAAGGARPQGPHGGGSARPNGQAPQQARGEAPMAAPGGTPRGPAPHGGRQRSAPSAPHGGGPRQPGTHPRGPQGGSTGPSQAARPQRGPAAQQHAQREHGHAGAPPSHRDPARALQAAAARGGQEHGRGPHGPGASRSGGPPPHGPRGDRRPRSAPEVTRVARPPAPPHRNGPTS